jgi:hypothetical protein
MTPVQLREHLLPDSLLKTLPPLYSTESLDDPPIKIKFFVPWNNWTFYVIEGSEEDDDVRFFGLVDGLEKELGYFVLSELMSVRGPGGLTVERDLHFHEQPLSNFQ